MKYGATRRRPPASKEFYTEVPFEMEVDGPYYSMLNFFERTAKLERIVNVNGLALGAIKSCKTGGARQVRLRAERERGCDLYREHLLQSRQLPLPPQLQKPAAK